MEPIKVVINAGSVNYNVHKDDNIWLEISPSGLGVEAHTDTSCTLYPWHVVHSVTFNK